MPRRYENLMLLLVAFLMIGASGCRRTTLLAGAIACQGIGGRADTLGEGQWSFKGLDPRIRPRLRPGSYSTATDGVQFLGPADLGAHGYYFDWSERSGIVYTCRAGHIDIAHVRKAADLTGYLAALTLQNIQAGRTQFQFKSAEPSVYFVTLTFPPGWNDLDPVEQEPVVREVSREIGAHLAYTAMTWHEILTWFGYQPRPYKSEFPSAFSWEDGYSNLLGVHVAAAALSQEDLDFSEAVTDNLRQRLDELEVQPADVARQAAEAVQGQWYGRRWFGTRIWKRNFDVGLDDGYVTPCLVPSVATCPGAQPQPLAIPALDSLARYGFSMTVEIEPKVWERKKIMRALEAMGHPAEKRLDPVVCIPLLIDYCSERWRGVPPVTSKN